ncbi:SpoIIE family protein phosphatase [Kitasatospora sp. NE20-6]|uniref:SpoIIE family protein phosphatase n=1 Tax=Kitasatospora sp. NE20-6 TaxID=2859066 RepID=UPI0038B33E25
MDDRRFPFLDGVAGALVDGRGTIVGCTDAFEDLLSLPARALVGRPLRDLLARPDDWHGLHGSPGDGTGDGPGPHDSPGDGPRTGPGTRDARVTVRTGDGRPLGLDVRVLTLHGGDPADPGAVRQVVLGAPSATVVGWRQDQAFTRELFLQDRFGLAVFDTDLRVVRTNTHLLPYTGVPPTLTGLRLADFLQPEDAVVVEGHLREVLETGRPLVLAEEPARTVVDPRSGRMMAISAFRLQDAVGTVIGVTVLFTDITEQHRSRRRLALLHRVTAAAGASLSVSGTAEDLARALVPELADVAVVDIAAAVFTGDEPVADGDGQLLLRRTAVAGPPGSSPATGDSVLVRPGADPAAPSEDPAGAWALHAPLTARGILLGQVTTHRDRWKDPYEDGDRLLLAEIAARSALAVDNARRYTREHRAAVALQRSLLPPSVRTVAAVTTAGVYLPTDSAGGVGGDWFDVIPLSSARVALVVGDVAGHGLQATATMGRLRTAVRTLADLDLEPDELLVHLDDLVSQLLIEGDFQAEGDDPAAPAGAEEGRTRPEPGSLGATCLYAVYDPVTRCCTLASAGHPPPAVVEPDGTARYLPVSPGPPLGVGGLPFEATEAVLAPGSVIALYTDGLIERGEGDIDEGMAELRKRLLDLTGPDRPLREAAARITAGLPPTRLRDDVALLLARTRAVPAADTAVWSVEPDPAAVGRVRADACARLTEWGLDDLAFTTELILSELVTNAIRYAGGPVGVRLIRADTLTCEVSDGSSTQPRMRRARLTDEGGRGLYLIAQLASRWGSRYTARGKTIWTEQELPPARGGF